jgi:hypothetical protein
VVENVITSQTEQGAVEAFPVMQGAQGIGDVLRMEMVSGSERFS